MKIGIFDCNAEDERNKKYQYKDPSQHRVSPRSPTFMGSHFVDREFTRHYLLLCGQRNAQEQSV